MHVIVLQCVIAFQLPFTKDVWQIYMWGFYDSSNISQQTLRNNFRLNLSIFENVMAKKQRGPNFMENGVSSQQ